MKTFHTSTILLFALILGLLVFFLLPSNFLPFSRPVSSQNDRGISSTDFQELTTALKSAKYPSIAGFEKFNEWCQADYKDLSQNVVFDEFGDWFAELIEIQNNLGVDYHENNSTNLKTFLSDGERLAEKRAKILQRIIRGDPKTALDLAITPENLKALPPSIQEHIEIWRSEFVDIQSMHVCYDPKHPGGYMHRYATLENGTKLRAWVFGKRRNLPSVKGLAAWGISIGLDFAISIQKQHRNQKSTLVLVEENLLIQRGGVESFW